MEQVEAKLDSAKGAVAASMHAAQRALEQAEVVVASVEAVMKRGGEADGPVGRCHGVIGQA